MTATEYQSVTEVLSEVQAEYALTLNSPVRQYACVYRGLPCQAEYVVPRVVQLFMKRADGSVLCDLVFQRWNYETERLAYQLSAHPECCWVSLSATYYRQRQAARQVPRVDDFMS
jgi:hypothetical protein